MTSEAPPQSWSEFLLQCFISHWLLTLCLVGITAAIAALITKLTATSINATTRHNIWLLTLTVFALMPLLVFIPMSTKVDFFPSSLLSKQSIPAALSEGSLPLSKNELLPGNDVDQSTTEVSQIDVSRADLNSTNRSSAVNRVEVDSPQMNDSTGLTSAPYEGRVVFPLSVTAVLKVLIALWALGAMVMVWRFWVELQAARHLRKTSEPVGDYFQRRFDRLCQRLNVSSRPELRYHFGISAPMTVGLIRVWIAVPLDWRATVDDQMFDQTLTHELGHVARWDPWVNVLQKCLGVLFWLYPSYWYVSRQLELERESACDDWVLQHDDESEMYAENLIDVAEALYLQPTVLAVGCLRSPSQLSRRIHNLVNLSCNHALVNSWKQLAGVALGLVTTLSVSAIAWPDFPNLGEAVENHSVHKVEPYAKIEPTSNLRQPPKRRHSDPLKQTVNKPLNKMRDKIWNKPINARVDTRSQISPAPANVQDRLSHIESIATDGTQFGSDKGEATKDLHSLYGPIKYRHKPLLAAIKRGDQAKIAKLLSGGISHDKRAVTLALIRDRHDIVKQLLDAGVSADEHALALAIGDKDKPLVDRLIASGAKASSNSLTLAIAQDDHALIDKLVKLGAKPDDNSIKMLINNKDEELLCRFLDEKTLESGALSLEGIVLHAIHSNQVSAIRLLLDKGVTVTEPIYQAAVNHQNVKIQRLVNQFYRGSVDNHRHSKNHSTADNSAYGDGGSANKLKVKHSKLNQPNKSPKQHKDDFGLAHWPIDSRNITLRYGEKAKRYMGNTGLHYAIDFAAPSGTSVRAVADGKVVEAGYSEGFGHYILLDHGDGYQTRYANNKKNKVVLGEQVQANDEIAFVGTSAKHVTRPHLHFEVKFHQHKLNPEMLFTDVR